MFPGSPGQQKWQMRMKAQIPVRSINKTQVMKKPAKANKPYNSPRRTCAAAAGPWWRWAKMVRMVTYSGTVVSNPVRRGPRKDALPVINRMKLVPIRMREGISQFPGFASPASASPFGIAQAQCDHRANDQKNRDQGKGDILQQGGADRKNSQAAEQGHIPMEVFRQPGIGQCISTREIPPLITPSAALAAKPASWLRARKKMTGPRSKAAQRSSR